MSQDDELKKLLEIASQHREDTGTERSKIEVNRLFNRFIRECGLEDGADKIPVKFIHQVYKDWTHGLHYRPGTSNELLGKKGLFMQLKTIFRPYCSQGERGYYLNGDKIGYTVGGMVRARQNWTRNVNKKKNKKKSSQVPGTE